MRPLLLRLAAVRLVAVLATLALLPLVPIAAVKLGFTSPDYLRRGVLQGPGQTEKEISIVRTYVATIKGLATAAFGRSLATGQPVNLLLKESLVATGPILGLVVLLALIVGGGVGIATSLHRIGVAVLAICSVLACVPVVVLAYVSLECLSSTSAGNATGVRSLMVAALLALYPTYLAAKTTRSALADLMASEHAQFLRACGFSERNTLLSQAPKPLLLRFLALVYPTLLYSLSFAFFVEAPLGIPGFGHRFLTAVQTLDYPVIIAFSVCGFLVLTVVELALTLTQAVCDPRLRYG